MSKWGQAIEPHYLSEQINGMLEQIGYRPVSDTSPWTKIRLSGQTNAQAAEEIMDWYTVHNFFDCGSVEDIYEMEGSFFALLRHDYSLADAAFPAVYDSVNRKLYVRKTAEVDVYKRQAQDFPSLWEFRARTPTAYSPLTSI